MELISKLNWRYATKRMNGEKLTAEQLNAILDATRLSASSYGLQPYKVLVIENEELRDKLKKAAYNQPQITECSHLLVFSAYEEINQKHIDEFIALQAKSKELSIEALAPFKGMLEQNILNRSTEVNFNWASRQVYIALGTALIAAAGEKVDATPMEGFNPSEFDEILELKKHGLKSVVLLALGFRDENNDTLAKAKKVRKNLEDFVVNFN